MRIIMKPQGWPGEWQLSFVANRKTFATMHFSFVMCTKLILTEHYDENKQYYFYRMMVIQNQIFQEIFTEASLTKLNFYWKRVR